MDVGNLISGSSAFSKTSLNIRKFTVHVLLKPGLENFEHSLALPFFGIGLPWWLSWQRVCPQRGRPRFDPWVGKIPWRRKWQSTPVFLPVEFHGQRSLVGYSPWGHKEPDMTA